MTDYELMLFRFNRKNIRKSTGAIAKELGMDREVFEEAVRRGLEEENKKGEKNEVFPSTESDRLRRIRR
jgi:predicted transposase YbfD/YdcC